MSLYFYADGMRPKVKCITSPSIAECIAMIDHDIADVINLSSDDLFKYRSHVRPIMSADYDHGMYFFSFYPKIHTVVSGISDSGICSHLSHMQT